MPIFQYLLFFLTLFILASLLILQWITQGKNRKERQRQAKARQQLDHDLQAAYTELEREKQRCHLLQAIVDAQEDSMLVFTVDEDFTPQPFCESNETACRFLEHDKTELMKLTPMDIELIREPEMQRPQGDIDRLSLSNANQLPRDSKFARRTMQRVIKKAISEHQYKYESSVVTQSGRRIPVEISIVSKQGESTPARLIYVLRDITQKKSNQTALRHCREQHNEFFQSTLVGAAQYNAQQQLVRANSALLRIFGCPHMDDFSKFSLFETNFIPEAIHQQVQSGENASCEVTFDLDIMMAQQQFVTNRRGKAILEIFFQNLGVDSDHHPIGHLVQIRDLTDLRETESALQLREAQLRQARKMEAIGTMTSGIAHDFNNILTPILGYSEMGLEVCDKSSRLYEFIREIRVSTLRAKQLVQQILVFSRQSDEATTQIHLAPIIKEVAKQQSSALPTNITVNYAIRTEADLVLANPTQVHQILTNFATNAAYAMRDTGGQLDIQLSQFNMGWRHRQEFPNLKKGTYLRISVRDTGGGIPEDVRERVFDPFFSTKPTGEGTGMGLAVVKGIVDALGGDIAIETLIGEGTTFHVALPLVDAPPVEEATTWHPPTAAAGGRILFVDDELHIAKLAPHMLQSLGYRVKAFTSPGMALECFKHQPAAFDLLITDQVMPVMTGAELAAAAREIRPDLPVIIVSGYSEQITNETADDMQIDAFLQKPITRRDLGETIRRVMHPQVPVQTVPQA